MSLVSPNGKITANVYGKMFEHYVAFFSSAAEWAAVHANSTMRDKKPQSFPDTLQNTFDRMMQLVVQALYNMVNTSITKSRSLSNPEPDLSNTWMTSTSGDIAPFFEGILP
jgi:hypothetical protein